MLKIDRGNRTLEPYSKSDPSRSWLERNAGFTTTDRETSKAIL